MSLTAPQAKALARAYAWTCINTKRRLGKASDHHLDYVVDMATRMQALPDDAIPKLMRWLGFIQGVMWSRNLATVSDLKAHTVSAIKGAYDMADVLPALNDEAFEYPKVAD